VDSSGNVVGEHAGVAGFTIGQRKGIGAFGTRRFVTAIDPASNLVQIGDEEELLSRRLWAEGLSWTEGEPQTPLRAEGKVRYKSTPQPATISFDGSRADILLDQPQRAVTPGQAAVFYDGERVLGGGIIAGVERLSEASASGARRPA